LAAGASPLPWPSPGAASCAIEPCSAPQLAHSTQIISGRHMPSLYTRCGVEDRASGHVGVDDRDRPRRAATGEYDRLVIARVALIAFVAACRFSATIARSDAGEGNGDGPAHDASLAGCPMTYASIPDHTRYRVLAGDAAFGVHHRTCAADAPGLTHLVVIDNVAEANAVDDFADAGEVWIGVVQMPNAPGVAEGWFTITGGSVAPLWISGEPNDAGDPEDNHQNAGKLVGNELDDDRATDARPAVCECDGIPIDPIVDTYVP
jgi:hypothetical protein